ncbi:hypothetical protein [Lonepinella sp. BR2474]|uniref:hypothetical protein n=1 Tax=Lonepinella sp. BR2474 TaxID=3434548 RepID=UPI003F6DB57A
MTQQIKSKKRVADHGEVFTRPEEVNAMIDMVERQLSAVVDEMPIKATFLEPACGDGNFLIEILKRKLNTVAKNYQKSPREYEFYLILAISSLYGIELLQDNVLKCRQRLLDFVKNEYQYLFGLPMTVELENVAKFILERNILHGDALKMCYADQHNQPLENQFLHFSQWSAMEFPRKFCLKREEYQYTDVIQIISRGSKREFSHYTTLPKYNSIYFMEIQNATPESKL